MQRHAFSQLTALALCVPFAAALAQEEPAELTQTKAMYQRDVETATRPIRERYLGRLELLKKSIAARGDIRAALAVQEEIEKVKEIGSGMERFAGTWSLQYSNGTIRVYVITPDGTVTYSEENGKKIPQKTAKILAKGADFIVEAAEGTVERLSINGTKLMLDHFNPKSTYPAGKPAARATGTKTAASKP